jgi:hypothetical protein
LTGQGEIRHADVTLSGNFIDNDRLNVPISVKFLSTNYEKTYNVASALNMEATT